MNKNQNGKNNPNYKDGHCVNTICLDCGVKIHPQAKRCGKCEDKHHAKILTGRKNNAQSQRMTGRNNPNFGKPTHGKGSYYRNIWMRSTWEIAIAKWYDKNSIEWQYEPKAFDLGHTTYTPDFYLPEFNLYVEVKGYWRNDAKDKFIEFKQRYCGERIKVLEKEELNSMNIIKRR